MNKLASLFILGLMSAGFCAAAPRDFFLRPATSVESDDTDRLFSVGMDLAAQSRWADAVALFEQVIRQRPQHREALHMCGLCLWQVGQTKRAERYLMLASRHPLPASETFLALAALHASQTNLLSSGEWLRKGLRDLDEGARLNWLTNDSLQSLWVSMDPGFRSVLEEFGLPTHLQEAQDRARVTSTSPAADETESAPSQTTEEPPATD